LTRINDFFLILWLRLSLSLSLFLVICNKYTTLNTENVHFSIIYFSDFYRFKYI
jgi:hypothetical protein